MSDAPTATPAADRLIRMVRDRASVPEVISVLFNEYGLLDQLEAVPSAKHPQGFLTFKLGLSTDKKEALRFHVWLPNKREVSDQKDFPIHDHVFGFTSLLLTGNMTNHVYEVAPSLSETGNRLFRVDYTNVNEDTVVREPLPVSVTLASAIRHEASDYYSMEAGIYHTSVVPVETLTMTLLSARAAVDKAAPRMVGPASVPTPPVNRRPRPDQQDIHFIRQELSRLA